MSEDQNASIEIEKHRAVIDSLEDFNDGPMYNDDIREIYATILKVMKEIRA